MVFDYIFIHDMIYPVISCFVTLSLDLDQNDTVVVSLGEGIWHLFYFALYVVKSEWANNGENNFAIEW